MVWEPRTYRRWVQAEGLVSFEAVLKETDLHISARRDLKDKAEDLIAEARWDIESFIGLHPRFAESFVPYPVPEDAPKIVKAMADAADQTQVGPMAAVAGAVAEHVARGLVEESPEVIVENGGDIYMMGPNVAGGQERLISLLAGDSPMSGKVGLRISPGLLPLAVCTSSGTVGPSLSLGSADAVTVLARSGALADAAATALGNLIHEPDDVEKTVSRARSVMGILGVVAVSGPALAAWGSVHLVPLD